MKFYFGIPFLILSFFVLTILTNCRSTKSFSCVFQNPLDYAYDSLLVPDTFAIRKIKTYTKFIDSLSENDEDQKFIIKTIEEGTITQGIVKTSIVGHNNHTDTARKIKNGGFGKYTIGNLKGDTLYKVLYHDNINKNFYESYYFKDNKLIYSKIDYQEDGIGKTFYFKEEYYKDGKVLVVNESTVKIDIEFRQRVTFDFIKKGNAYYTEFLSHR
jgi:hypothetical protein